MNRLDKLTQKKEKNGFIGNRQHRKSNEKAAEFIGANRVEDENDVDYGLILAYEGTPGEVNTCHIDAVATLNDNRIPQNSNKHRIPSRLRFDNLNRPPN